jgi:FMN phosphatase YigB (HAD superfamily)
MIGLFEGVKSVIFDLDGTLYSSNFEIDERIAKKFAQKVLDKKPELKTIEEANRYAQKRYAQTSSKSQILRELGYENVSEVMLECLSNADVLDLIKKDKKLVKLLEDLKDKYKISLLTSSPKSLAIPKLEKIGIDPKIFHTRLYGCTSPSLKKTDGSIFRFFLRSSGNLPSENAYIGDLPAADILPPKLLGMKTIIVGTQNSDADCSIEKIHDLREVLL